MFLFRWWVSVTALALVLEMAQVSPVLALEQHATPQLAQTIPIDEAAQLNRDGERLFYASRYRDALNRFEQALAIYQQPDVREVFPQESRRGEGTTLNNMGAVYRDLGDYPQALTYYQRSLVIRQEIGDRAGEGATLNNMGRVYDNLGDYPQALTYYQRSLVIRQEIGHRAGEGTTLNNIGLVYHSLGDYPQALTYFQRSLAIRQDIGDRAGEAITLDNLGTLLNAMEQMELAIAFLKQSVNVYEAIRGDNRSLTPEQQQFYTQTVEDTYRRLADLLLQQDRVLEAQRVLDLLKVQELDDYLRGVERNAQTESGVAPRPAEQDIWMLYQASQRQLIALGRELTQLAATPVAARTAAQAARIAELRQLQGVMVQDLSRFFERAEVQTLVGQLRQTTGAVNLELTQMNDLRDNLRRLDQNAVILYPLILDDRLELVLVTADSPPIRRTVTIRREDLNRAIGALRSALRSPSSDAISPAQALYDLLIRPLEADLAQAGAETLIYAPDGQLRYLPLAALHDGNGWLVQRFRVNNITAASLDDLNHQPGQGVASVLAGAFTEGRYDVRVGDRTLSFDGLQFAGREVENLASLIPQTQRRLNQTFQPSIVYEMDDYPVVHLATHAAFNPGPPEDSFILFGNGDRATLTDVQSWNFPNVDLIVLSACETAVGDVPLGSGVEILGFGYLMQQAGADAAIASLWSVSDGGTQALMDAFYAALQRPSITKAEALRQAQMALITGDFTALEDQSRGIVGIRPRIQSSVPEIVFTRLNHPYYWAPFILIGNGL